MASINRFEDLEAWQKAGEHHLHFQDRVRGIPRGICTQPCM